MSQELKPCPFCGRGAHVQQDADFPAYEAVRCEGCGIYHFGSQLAERWNRRTPPHATRQLLAYWQHHPDEIRPGGWVETLLEAFAAEWAEQEKSYGGE